MKDDVLEKIISLFFKYLWFVCGLLICANAFGMLITAYSIVRNTAQENLTSLATELSHRFSVTYNLLEGISDFPYMADLSIDVKDRAATLKPFANSFGLWMIGVVDMDGTISSTYAYKSSKVERDYIPRIQQSGMREMTDIFPAGATGDMNYTLLVPVKKEGKVVSIVFASSLLSELNTVVTRTPYISNGYYILLDSKQNIIGHPSEEMLFKNILQLNMEETMLFNETQEKFTQSLQTRKPGAYISWFNDTLIYTVYTPLEASQWMLVHRVKIIPMFKPALMVLVLQTLLTIAVFTVLYVFGNMYIQRALLPVDNILKQVINLNKELMNTDKVNTEEVSDIIRISKKGLKDELTNLPTRMFFRQILNVRLRNIDTLKLAAVFFIDMDNLKTINDSFGHKYGDKAISYFGSQLQDIVIKYTGLAARYGGDEFVLFVENLENIDAVKAVAEELSQRLRGYIEKDGERHQFHSSIGIALYPVDSPHIDMVIQLADIALYESKQRGKNSYTMYSPEIAKHRKNMLRCFC